MLMLMLRLLMMLMLMLLMPMLMLLLQGLAFCWSLPVGAGFLPSFWWPLLVGFLLVVTCGR